MAIHNAMAGVLKPETLVPVVKTTRWKEDEWDEDAINFHLKKDNQNYFHGVIKSCNCCGVREVCDWNMNFQSYENCKEILDEFIVQYHHSGDMLSAYLMFVTINSSKDRNMTLIRQYLEERDNVFYTPEHLNKNSNNIIQVFMIAV